MAEHLIYIAPFTISTIMMLWISFKTWPRRRSRGGLWLILFCLGAGYWSFTEGLLYLGLDIEIDYWITCFQYFGIAVLAPTGLVLSCVIFGFESWLRPPRAGLLFAVPGLSLVAVWTNSWHHLFYTDWFLIDSGPFPMLGLDHGPLFWLNISYNYILLGITSFLLVHQFSTSAGFKRGQAGVILFSILLVWTANGIYLTGRSPIPNMDVSSIAFSFVAISLAWGFSRYSFLEIMPIAKAEIFDGFVDAILVFDKKNRFIAVNPAGEQLIERPFESILGKNVEEIFKQWPETSTDHFENKTREMQIDGKDHERIYELRFSILKDWKDQVIGKLVVFNNITERKRLENKLIRLATTDPLTGVYNRRQIFELAQVEFKKNKRYEHGLSVAMIDLDDFKKINDQHGHDNGDIALKTLAATCRASLRGTDYFGRFGGEEFVVILPATKLSDAEKVAEKLRKRIEATQLPVMGKNLQITVSIGVTFVKPQDTSFDDTLIRADRALYRAKGQGKNRVVSDESSTEK